MRNKTIKSLLLPALCFIAANGQAQGTLEDYRRAYSLYEKFNATQVYNDPADIRWDGKTTFHYSVYTPEGTDYYVGRSPIGQHIQHRTVKDVRYVVCVSMHLGTDV